MLMRVQVFGRRSIADVPANANVAGGETFDSIGRSGADVGH